MAMAMTIEDHDNNMTSAVDDNVVVADDNNMTTTDDNDTLAMTMAMPTRPRKPMTGDVPVTVESEPVLLWSNYDATRPVFSSPCLLLLPKV